MPKQSEIELIAAIDHAEFLKDLCKDLQESSKNAELHAQILEAESKATSRAWEKIVKKHPGACKIFSGGGGGIKGLAKKAQQLKNAIQKMDSKTEKERKTAGTVVLTSVLWLSGYPLAGLLGPWLADTNWKILKWEGKQIYKAMDWMLKNMGDAGSGIKDLCKNVKPDLPDKVEKIIKKSK